MKITQVAPIIIPLFTTVNGGRPKNNWPARKRYIRRRLEDNELPPPPPPPPPIDYPNCLVDNPNWVGDGYCDSGEPYNTEACGWDGGDCCVGTCVDRDYECGVPVPFNCQDPSQPTTPPTEPPTLPPPPPPPIDYPNCQVEIPEYVGDGWCDSEGGYNTEACGWDGGDCCESTCVDGAFECGVNAPYDCQDPSPASTTPSPTPAPFVPCTTIRSCIPLGHIEELIQPDIMDQNNECQIMEDCGNEGRQCRYVAAQSRLVCDTDDHAYCDNDCVMEDGPNIVF